MPGERPIPTIALSRNGPELSRLAYGTWRTLEDADAAAPQGLLRRLEACLEVGITTIDTAEIYGRYRVETLVGEALRLSSAVRERVQIVTKCGIYVPTDGGDTKVAHYDATAARVVASVEKSLRLLGVDTIDLLLIHRPDWLTGAAETARALDGLLTSGKIRFAGVSNHSVHQFRTLNGHLDGRLVTNQIEMSLLQMQGLFDGTLDQCQELGIRPMAWSPLGGGRLFDPGDEAGSRIRTTMKAIAGSYGDASPDQLALAWILAHPSGPVPIIGTNRIERITSAAAATSIELERQDWYALWEAAQGRQIP